MVIINLEKQKREERYNLFIDGNFFSGISLDCVVKYGLKNNLELNLDKVKEIVIESETSYAFNKALKYLSKSMKTEGEIKTYLLGKKINKDCVFLAIEKLKDYGYINDEQYVKSYIDFYKQKYGKLILKQNLLKKNINEEIIEKYLDFDEDENLNLVKNLIEKQLKNKEYNEKLKQKIIRNILNKGFSYEIIKKAFKQINEGEDFE